MNIKEIKEDYDFNHLKEHSVASIFVEVERIEWLIEQAEKVERYEKEIEMWAEVASEQQKTIDQLHKDKSFLRKLVNASSELLNKAKFL